jgi:hypothetical protein
VRVKNLAIDELAEVQGLTEHPVERALVTAVDEHDDISGGTVEVDEVCEDLVAVGITDSPLQLVEEQNHGLAAVARKLKR